MAKSKKSLTKEVVECMTSLGVYRPEYDRMISVYVDTLIDYLKRQAELREQGAACFIETGKGGLKKHPVMLTLETDRRDLLAYGEALGLTPRAMKKLMDGQETKESTEIETGDAVTERLEALLYGGSRDDE